MAINPYYVFVLVGANGRKTTLRYVGKEIDNGDQSLDLNEAMLHLEALRNALNPVTDANVDAYYIQVPGTQAVGGLPADADIFEEAALTLDITPPGEATKLATVRIPAPSIGIFSGVSGPSRDIVNVADVDLVDFVTGLSLLCLESDGEAINGVVSGIRRAKGGKTS